MQMSMNKAPTPHHPTSDPIIAFTSFGPAGPRMGAASVVQDDLAFGNGAAASTSSGVAAGWTFSQMPAAGTNRG